MFKFCSNFSGVSDRASLNSTFSTSSFSLASEVEDDMGSIDRFDSFNGKPWMIDCSGKYAYYPSKGVSTISKVQYHAG